MENDYQDKLSHLTDDQVNELMSRYYDGEKNSTLIDEYEIDISSSLLVKAFPMKGYPDILCPYCEIAMVSYRKSKSAYGGESIFCSQCGHQKGYSYCRCPNCLRQREIQEELRKNEEKVINERKRQVILETYSSESRVPINIAELSIKDKLYICSLLRTTLDEDLSTLEPVSSSHLKLAPTQEYMNRIISYLRNIDILIFSPDTPLDSVVVENDKIISYYPLNARFKVNIDLDEYEGLIQYLLNLDDVESIDDEVKISLWEEIGLNEVLEYLYARMEEYNLPVEYIGDKTISSIKKALDEYSVSQVFNFIWRAVKNAAAFYQKGQVSKKHAVNTISGNILRSSEKAKAEGWEIKGYGRDYNYPQSIISEVFFNNILKIGELGFTSVIAK